MSDYFDRVERQIARRVEAGLPRRSRMRVTVGHLAVAAAAVVVIVVVGVFLAVGGNGGGKSTATRHNVVAGHDVSVTLGIRGAHVSAAVLEQSVRILRERMHAVFPDVEVNRVGQQIAIDLRNAPAGARSEILALAVPGRLAFYDWEADVMAPNGKTVASQLRAGNRAALEISQGSGGEAPGGPEAGGISLHRALALVPKAATGGRLAVLQAIDPDPQQPTRPDAPNARFYVVRGGPALSGTDVANPKVRTDPNNGAPDVTFDFTATGRRAFEALTAAVARRGSLVSSPGETLNQHFAVAIDNRLITVPFIDSKTYPDGINGGQGADVAGSFTTRSAKNLAILLRYGPLPVNLTATG